MSGDAGVSFKRPPITEVVYSFQFEPLKNYHLGFTGLVWGEYRDDFPVVEEDNPLEHEIERFGGVKKHTTPQIRFTKKAPVPRIKMTSADNSMMLQVQADRFVFNWRNYHDSNLEYPRFGNLIKRFAKELEKFEAFVANNELGELKYNQIEVTNVNHIPKDGREFSQVFTDLACGVDISEELEPESFSFNLSHRINNNGSPIGRLYTAIEKALFISDHSELYKLNFTARAHPSSQDKSSGLEMVELLRNVINKAFVNLTTPTMHREWGQE